MAVARRSCVPPLRWVRMQFLLRAPFGKPLSAQFVHLQAGSIALLNGGNPGTAAVRPDTWLAARLLGLAGLGGVLGWRPSCCWMPVCYLRPGLRVRYRTAGRCRLGLVARARRATRFTWGAHAGMALLAKLAVQRLADGATSGLLPECRCTFRPRGRGAVGWWWA